MKRKAAFFDWDGTLSVNGYEIPPANIDALRALQRAGHAAFLCTGRSAGFIPAAAAAVRFDGLVAAAGADVRLGGRQLLRRFVLPEHLPAILAHFLSTGQTCVLEGERQMAVVNDPGRFPADWPRVTEADGYTDQVVSKLTLYGPITPATEAVLSPAYTMIRHETYTEVVPTGCCKSEGIRLVLDALGIDREDCWAFGDSFNDLDMLAFAGVGVAMANAPDAVKAAADRVAGPGGVAQALEELLA